MSSTVDLTGELFNHPIAHLLYASCPIPAPISACALLFTHAPLDSPLPLSLYVCGRKSPSRRQ